MEPSNVHLSKMDYFEFDKLVNMLDDIIIKTETVDKRYQEGT